MKNRDNKRKLIVRNACEIFLKKGLFNVVMDDIAISSGLTRRTLYRYFETKEDLAYETCIVLLQQWNSFIKDVYSELTGTGLEQLESFLLSLIDYMSDRTDIMKFLGEFDFYFKDDRIEKPSTAGLDRFNSIILESDQILIELINRGTGDHSIKQNIDIRLMVATISNVLWGFGQRIAIRNRQIVSESGYSGIEIIRHQVSLYISALKEN